MKQCSITTCENTNLVYSGVDAMMLGGIPTEKYCYSCAYAYSTISSEIESMLNA